MKSLGLRRPRGQSVPVSYHREAVARHWLGRARSLIVAGMMAPLDDDEDVETVRARKSPSCIGTLPCARLPTGIHYDHGPAY